MLRDIVGQWRKTYMDNVEGHTVPATSVKKPVSGWCVYGTSIITEEELQPQQLGYSAAEAGPQTGMAFCDYAVWWRLWVIMTHSAEPECLNADLLLRGIVCTKSVRTPRLRARTWQPVYLGTKDLDLELLFCLAGLFTESQGISFEPVRPVLCSTLNLYRMVVLVVVIIVIVLVLLLRLPFCCHHHHDHFQSDLFGFAVNCIVFRTVSQLFTCISIWYRVTKNVWWPYAGDGMYRSMN